MADRRSTEGSRTVGRVLRVLELIAGENKAMRLVDIARTLELPVSSVHLLLQELLKFNYVKLDKNEARYRQSSGLVLLANRVLAGSQLIRAAKPVLESLATTLNESVYIGMSHSLGIVYVDGVEQTYGLLSRLPLGVPRPMHASSSAMLYLAFHIGPEMLDATLADMELTAITSRTITDRTKLKTMVHHAIREGYTINDQAVNEAVSGVSAPIFFADRTLAGTVTVSIPVARFEGRQEQIVKQTMAAASAVSRNLGLDDWDGALAYYQKRLINFEDKPAGQRRVRPYQKQT